MINSTAKPKYEHLAEALRNEIVSGRLNPGDAIPSQQQLIDRYRVSLSTVRKSLSRLAEEGYVGARHGKGVFVLDAGRRAAQAQQKAIGFVMLNDRSQPDVMDLAVLNGATQAAQKLGRRLLYNFVTPTPEGVENLEQFLGDVDGVILRTSPPPPVIDCLRRHRAHIVSLDRPQSLSMSQGEYSTVHYEDRSSGYSVGQILGLHGHRKVVLLHFSSAPAVRPMVSGLRRACEDFDMAPPEVLESHGKEQNLRVTRELGRREDISAVIVVGWGHCNTFTGRLIDWGVGIPEDKSILAIGNPHTGDIYEDLDISGIVWSGARLGREAVRILIESPSRCFEKTLVGEFRKGSTIAVRSQ